MIVKIIQVILIVYLLIILVMFFKDYGKNKEKITFGKHVINYIIGFFAEFFDTIGIGCFAPLTTAFRIMGVPDELIPGTLNVGGSVAVLMESLIFITVIEVDPVTLLLMMLISAVGAFVGARFTTKVSKKVLQTVLAIALVAAAILMVCSMMGWMPGGGEDIGLSGVKLVVGLICNFILGALIPFGLGNYAPSMVIIYLLGMSPLVAFPIMMCSAATGLSSAAIGFMRQGNYHRRASIGVILGGAAGVLIAAFVVKSLPLTVLKWIVVAVALYTSFTLFKSASKQE